MDSRYNELFYIYTYRLSNDIDKAFGTVLALQLCQSSGTAVSLLLEMAVSIFILNEPLTKYISSLLFDPIY